MARKGSPRMSVSFTVHPEVWDRFSLVAKNKHRRSPRHLIAMFCQIVAAGTFSEKEFTDLFAESWSRLDLDIGVRVADAEEREMIRKLADALWAEVVPKAQLDDSKEASH